MHHHWPVKKAIVDLLISMNRPSQGAYVHLQFEFQNLLFHVSRRKPCDCWYLIIIFTLFSPSLSQLQAIFLSFVIISPTLCCCFKAMSLIEICPYRASMKENSKCTSSNFVGSIGGTEQGSQHHFTDVTEVKLDLWSRRQVTRIQKWSIILHSNQCRYV